MQPSQMIGLIWESLGFGFEGLGFRGLAVLVSTAGNVVGAIADLQQPASKHSPLLYGLKCNRTPSNVPSLFLSPAAPSESFVRRQSPKDSAVLCPNALWQSGCCSRMQWQSGCCSRRACSGTHGKLVDEVERINPDSFSLPNVPLRQPLHP